LGFRNDHPIAQHELEKTEQELRLKKYFDETLKLSTSNVREKLNQQRRGPTNIHFGNSTKMMPK
jgi:hypothetical protein